MTYDRKLIADMLCAYALCGGDGRTHPAASVYEQARLLRAADESDGWLPIDSAPVGTVCVDGDDDGEFVTVIVEGNYAMRALDGKRVRLVVES